MPTTVTNSEFATYPMPSQKNLGGQKGCTSPPSSIEFAKLSTTTKLELESKTVSFWGSCVQHAYITRAILGHHQCLAREQDQKGLLKPFFLGQ